LSSQELNDAVKAAGFTKEMLGFQSEDDFTFFIDGVIDRAQHKVRADVGAEGYASTDPEVAAAVFDAVVDWSVSKVWERRKARVLASAAISGEQRTRAGLSEEASIKAAMDDYEDDLRRVNRLAGKSPDLAVGAAVSSHFTS